MTHRVFDAPGASPRRGAFRPGPLQRQVVRIAWLIASLVHERSVCFARYRERFGLSLRTYRRDIAVLRDAGLYIDANGTTAYVMLCFRSEREAA